MSAPTPTLNRAHLRPGDRLCAAVSGGADSVALLLLLHAANILPRNALGVGLSAVHVHHGLRGPEANADLAFVQQLCARLEVPLHLRHASVPERIAATHADPTQKSEGLEEAARTLRYGCFRELLAQGHADAVLTAHTLDDQAETVLMKLLRGAWTEGLSGIHPVVLVDAPAQPAPTQPTHPASATPTAHRHHAYERAAPRMAFSPPSNHRQGRILRPLLAVPRAELRAFLESRNQPWREDATNTDPAHTRNRLRHTLLPILREENPALDQTLANLAELARDEEARWQAELARILPSLLLPGKPVRGGGRAVSTVPGQAETAVALELDRLRALDPALRRRVVRAAARTLGVRLTFDDTARLLALAGLPAGDTPADSTVQSGSSLHLAAGLRAQRSPRELRLSRPTLQKVPPA